MSEKDNWDKCKIGSDITIKIIEVIFLGGIALLIKVGTDNIAHSIEKGRLVQSLADQLVTPDAKRDIALIALNEALPGNKNVKCTDAKACENSLKHDQVFRIAEIVANRIIKDTYKLSQSPNLPSPDGDELSIAEEIIVAKTSQNYYDQKFGNRWKDALSKAQIKARSELDAKKKLQPVEAETKATLSKKFNDLQQSSTQPVDSDLAGIRLVYIQYKNDRTKAEKLRKHLEDKGIFAPGIEQVDGIDKNDIRYANAADKQIAEELRKFLDTEQDIGIKVESLIDLSESRYRVPSGQLEIWLKD